VLEEKMFYNIDYSLFLSRGSFFAGSVGSFFFGRNSSVGSEVGEAVVGAPLPHLDEVQPGADVIKRFCPQFTDFRNKLESFSSLV
jgi:hypothetical protein